MYKYFKRLIRRLIELKNGLYPYLIWRVRLRNDPLFKLPVIERGLLPRRASITRTLAQRTDVARRVLDAYKRASSSQASQRNVYKVSNEWLPIFRKPLQPLLNALEKGNPEVLRDLLDNFFRSTISTGLIGLATDMTDTFFSKPPSRFARMQMLIDSVYRYRLLEKLLPETQLAALHIEDFGNPYGMYVDDQFLRSGVDYQYYYANRVSEILSNDGKHLTVAELGGGIGGFAYFLCKARPAGLTYINLDLPEILCISSYFLCNLFPEKRILLFGEADTINSIFIAQYDLALLPSFAYESIDNNSVDIAFNSYSLAEMDRSTIENYASHISRTTSQAILHINHVAQSLVGADSFPFDMTKFELVDRTRALWNLGRSLQCDEYEFLLKRRP